MCGLAAALHHPDQTPLGSLNESYAYLLLLFYQILITYLLNTFYMSCLILRPKIVLYDLLVFVLCHRSQTTALGWQ